MYWDKEWGRIDFWDAGIEGGYQTFSFEDIIYHMMAGGILDTLEHPNQARYPRQKIHVVDVEGRLREEP